MYGVLHVICGAWFVVSGVWRVVYVFALFRIHPLTLCSILFLTGFPESFVILSNRLPFLH